MSCYHGVTTVVAGNCGFSVAPTKTGDRPFLEGIFAAVENMDPIALSGVAWNEFETFPEFLDSREGRLGVNFACYVGHSNLRRWVMGEDVHATRRHRRRDRRDGGDAARGVGGRALQDCRRRRRPPISTSHDRPVPSRLADRQRTAGARRRTRPPRRRLAGLPAEELDRRPRRRGQGTTSSPWRRRAACR